MKKSRITRLFLKNQKKSLDKAFIVTQARKPNKVGRRKETNAHLKLWLSFFMVISVVEQGQCIRENTTAHIAVTDVHPQEVRIDETAEKL